MKCVVLFSLKSSRNRMLSATILLQNSSYQRVATCRLSILVTTVAMETVSLTPPTHKLSLQNQFSVRLKKTFRIREQLVVDRKNLLLKLPWKQSVQQFRYTSYHYRNSFRCVLPVGNSYTECPSSHHLGNPSPQLKQHKVNTCI